MIRIAPMGTEAVLVEVDQIDAVALLDESLHRDAPPGIAEVVPAAQSLLVCFDPAVVSTATVADWVRRRWVERPTTPPAGHGDVLELPVRYDGEDLDELAALLRLSRRELIEAHLGASMVVAFCGFTPGFAYLRGCDLGVDVPRRPSPRTRVPAGAVGLAARFTGVYPRATPGGWQLIGTCPLTLWDVNATPPTPLWPGRPVRFIEIR